MKIYTKTGDAGDTGLFAGPRVPKDHVRIAAYGNVDELNATLGVARSVLDDDQLDRMLQEVQDALFAVGAELATPDPQKHGMQLLSDTHVGQLESWIDQIEATLPPLQHFILPAGSPAATTLHLARAVCRRAERSLVTLAREVSQPLSTRLLVYLNRLSDLLFVLARAANLRAGCSEAQWQKPR